MMTNTAWVPGWNGAAVDVGISAMELYVPNYFVDQSELELHDKVSPGKYTVGLGQKQMGFVGDNEDVNSLCLTVVHRLFKRQGYKASDFGRLEVGTESILDRSKSVKSVLMQLFESEGVTDLEGVDCINACYGGTSALFNTVNWMESSSWDGNRLGLVVAADIAVYAEGNARCTGGAGAVAIVVSPNAALVLDKGLRGTLMKHVYDFYKPELHSEYPQVDGPLSVECYLSALDICYERYKQKYEGTVLLSKGQQNGAAHTQSDMTSLSSEPHLSLEKTFDAILFHTPFCKIVQKSLGRLMLSEYLNQLPHSANDPKFDKIAKFEGVTLLNSFHNKALEKALTECSESLFREKTLPGLTIAQRVGNMYTPSLYGSLISYLISKDTKRLSDLCGKRVAMFSYGSGMAATMYSFTFSSHSQTLLSLIQPLCDVIRVLDERVKFSPGEYVNKLTHREEKMVNCRDFTPLDDVKHLQPHTYYLTHVDHKFRRHYKCHLGGEKEEDQQLQK